MQLLDDEGVPVVILAKLVQQLIGKRTDAPVNKLQYQQQKVTNCKKTMGLVENTKDI